MNGKVTYGQRYVRCGKQHCRKCQEGTGHGPYWYANWRENGRTISKYIGIHAPAEAEIQNQQISSPILTDLQTPQIRIYLLGQFRIERKEGTTWQTIASHTWQRQRVRALLSCLVSQKGHRLGREQVMEALWPEQDSDIGANRLNGAVHELRRILQPDIARPAASHLLRLEHGLLILADAPQVWVDAEAFEELLSKANTATNHAQVEQLLEEAAALYKGDYLLEELYSEWSITRRESLRRGWVGLLLDLAELRTARNALAGAIEPLDRLLTTDPTHETAVRRLMILMVQLDRRGEAIRIYQQLASLLKREYESKPLPETVELYEALCQGQIKTSRATTSILSQTNQNLTRAEGEKEHASSLQEEHNGADPLALPQILPHPHLPLRQQNQSPLIGRDRELEMLRQKLLIIGNTPARSARFVMIRGEVGIGKTRLAEELSHYAQENGWQVTWTRAYEQEGTIPYRPWIDILRSLLQGISLHDLFNLLGEKPCEKTGQATSASLTTTTQTRLSRLSILLPELALHKELHLSQNHARLQAVSEQDRFHLWETMLFLLNALSQSAPLLLVLDDLHWTDSGSLELLAYLVRRLQHERILLVGTYRDTELASDARLRLLLNDLWREQALETIPLQPLTPDQIGGLISYLPQELVYSIQNQARGNPLFAEELARGSMPVPGESSNKETSGNSYHPGNSDEMRTETNHLTPLPDIIAAILERHLNKLSKGCQALLSRAAVLGESFEVDLLLYMTGNPPTDEDTALDLLEEALRSGLLSEEAGSPRIIYHFWHPLIVSYLYKSISIARRMQLHRRAAQALIELHTNNETEVAALIVYHLGKYDPASPDLVYYAELAGNQAMTLAAYPEALHHYQQALNTLQPLNTSSQKQNTMHLADLLECMAECNTIQGNYSEARQQYIQVLELHIMRQADASTFANPDALLAWQQEEAQVQSIIWRLLGSIWNKTGDYGQAHTCVQKGKEILSTAGITNGVALACLEHLDGTIYSDEGDFGEARRHVEAALKIHAEALRAIQAREHLEGKPTSKANTHLSLLMTRSRRILQGDPLDLGLEREALGVICSGMGLYEEALQHLYAALMLYETHDLIGAMGQCCSNIGAVHTMRAEYEIAKVYFQRALEVTARTGDLPSKALITGNLGDIAWRCGDLQQAETWLYESLTLTEQITDRDGACWCLVTLGIVQHDLGKSHDALRKIKQAMMRAHQMNNTVRIGFALAVLADWLTTQALIRSKRQTTRPTKIAANTMSARLLNMARATAERALALEAIDSETRGIGQTTLAHIHFLQGNMDMAQRLALTTLEEGYRNEAIHLIGRAQQLLGKIQAARGFEQEAEKYFGQALLLLKRHGLNLEYARTLQSYGTSLLERNLRTPSNHEYAEDPSIDDSVNQRGFAYLREAHDLFEACQASVDLL